MDMHPTSPLVLTGQTSTQPMRQVLRAFRPGPVAIACALWACPGTAAFASPAPAPQKSESPALMPRPQATVIARLAELPLAPPCDGRKLVWVGARHRIEEILSPKSTLHLQVGQTIIVHQACPPRARDFARVARGDAGRLRPGARYRLVLTTAPSIPPRRLIDPFLPEFPRFRARRTDQTAPPPTIVLHVMGAGVAQKTRFQQRELRIGKDANCDVMLHGEAIAAQHLRIAVRGPTLWVLPIASAPVRVDNTPVPPGGVAITYKSRLTFGPYYARASVLFAQRRRSSTQTP